jgi:DNA polymerase elongation subunit (family B)
MNKKKKSLTLDQVIEKFIQYPKYQTYGAGKMSKRWGCTKQDIYDARKVVRAKKKTGRLPKILIFDIETSPMLSYHWGHWQQNIGLNQVVQNSIMITWSAKWLYSTKVMSDKVTVDEIAVLDDARICKSLYDLVDEADIVVGHHGDKFDVPMINTRFIINGLPPYSPTNSIDTKKVASKTFRFSSNKLDALAGYFGFGGKIKTDFDLWRGCMEGNQASLDNMETYNIQDVKVLEEVYLKMRPYIKSHPNVGLYLESDEPVCAACGSSDLHIEGKDYYTPTGRYDVYRCTCGAMSRCRTHNMDKDKRNALLTSSAK